MSEDDLSRSVNGVPHASLYMLSEMVDHGWSWRDLAKRMGGDVKVNELAACIWADTDDPHVHVGEEMAGQLALAFGNSPQFWLEKDAAWRREKLTQCELRAAKE
jgi:plasmid maintenance system antidote protein VapI